MESVMQIDSIANMLYAALGITKEALLESPTLLDSLVAANNAQAGALLGDLYVPIRKMDTIHSMNPPVDLKSHQIIPHFGEEVAGILITQRYPNNVGKAEGTFDKLFGASPDTSEKAEFGNSHRLSYIMNQFNPQNNSNFLDTLGLVNTYLYIGKNSFYFYATTKDYSDYNATSIEGAQDSRIRPVTNIVNGQGIFAGMAVDSIVLEVLAYPNTTVWPLERARIVGCRYLGWDSRSYCRDFLQTFCQDSLSTSLDCGPIAVAKALDSGLVWNALVADLTMKPPSPSSKPSMRAGPAATPRPNDSIKSHGERLYCIQNNFPSSAEVCAKPRQECLESKTNTIAMSTL
jgi:hypothetical protein